MDLLARYRVLAWPLLHGRVALVLTVITRAAQPMSPKPGSGGPHPARLGVCRATPELWRRKIRNGAGLDEAHGPGGHGALRQPPATPAVDWVGAGPSRYPEAISSAPATQLRPRRRPATSTWPERATGRSCCSGRGSLKTGSRCRALLAPWFSRWSRRLVWWRR